MAISDLSLFNSMAIALDTTTANIQGIQQSLASGKRVVQPSDDLVNYGQAHLLSARNSAVANDINTGTQVQGLLTTADNALSNVGNWVNAASSIATQGADGTMGTAQMSTLATQVQSILSQVTGAANTEYAGAYIFGGSQTNAAPYDPSANYLGDSMTNFATFSDGTKVQTTFDGSSIFGDANTGLIGTLNALQNALQTGNHAAVASTLAALQTGVQSVATARGSIGINESSLQAFISNANTESTTLQASISSLTDVDVASAALNQQQALLQEQALVSMASGLGKIPLVNILA
jgi:flagellar hook-associated protein 3 FlgL